MESRLDRQQNSQAELMEYIESNWPDSLVITLLLLVFLVATIQEGWYTLCRRWSKSAQEN